VTVAGTPPDGVTQVRFQHLPVHPKTTRHSSGQLLDLGRDLPTALARKEFHLEYQPIVDCEDGGVVAMEALLRWRHPVRGLIGPRTVIPLAEHSGTIHELGSWVLERALRDAVDWQHPGRPARLAVDIAPRQLMSAGFAATLADTIGRIGFPAELITLEIPESAFLDDSDRVLTVVREVRDVGASIALDNFGTGRTSFLHLRHYPVGTLKLDSAFTAELGLDSTTDTIVASMVTLAHDLGMTVVAAGVETAEQHRRVRALGCDACQGYRLSRPVPAAAVGQLLDRRAVAVPVIPAQMTAADLRPPPFLHRPPSAGDQLQQ
jgi:EAL domain-containing protein (putative c-di-GMP-specific phosphodiesterase class I)